jgi:osmotically-inducible protein OsmY
VRAFSRGDDEIRREIEEDVLARSLWLEEGAVSVDVAGGEATLAGTVDARSVAEILAGLVARVPGVVAVRSQVAWRDDDLRRRRGILAARSR